MAVAVPSRFAVLKIEDDDYRPKSSSKQTINKSKKNENKNIIKTKKVSANSNTKQVKNGVKSSTTTKTGKTDVISNKQRTAKAVETGVSSKGIILSNKNQKKKKDSDQWEKWRAKDMQLVDGTFEEDLQNAIFLSKLDYEENKELYQQNKQEENATEQQKDKEINGKKTKKKKAMSLEQFNNMFEKKNSPQECKSQLIPISSRFPVQFSFENWFVNNKR